MGIKGWILGLAVAGIAGEYGIVRYFFHRTAVRGNTERDRTWKMIGTDWDVYIPGIRANRGWLAGQPQEKVYTTSRDGLRFHGMFFYCEDSEKVMVCFHGYTSEGSNDYVSTTKFYLGQGFSSMVVDERARGKNEGTYIGFDCLDHNDAKQWMEYMAERLGEDYELTPHDIPVGVATVLMPTDPNLPKQVRVVVSDCAFTSAWGVLSHMFRSMYYVPAFPMIQIADRMARSETGYDLNECNVREEVKKIRIPILFIHGDRDTFVPCSTAYRLYETCMSPKELLVIPEVSHAEVYYKEADRYEHAIEEPIARFFGKRENKA